MIYYVKANLWQQIFIIQPVDAENEEEARKKFLMATAGRARDVEIEELFTDEARLQEVIDEESIDDEDQIIH